MYHSVEVRNGGLHGTLRGDVAPPVPVAVHPVGHDEVGVGVTCGEHNEPLFGLVGEGFGRWRVGGWL